MKLIYIFTIIFIVSSCGGGGGSSSSDSNYLVPPDPVIDTITESCSPTSWNYRIQRCDLNHDNLERYYFLYRPENLNLSESIPVLFALHGYGSTARNHLYYTNYAPMADNNNFIVVYPQGFPMRTVLASSNSHWNVGGWTIGSDVNDVDFIDSVINLISKKIPIDEDRIYSSGMSNGGFMSYHLVCNLSNKIAAIASVTGSMTPETYEDCNPSHPTPVLQIHGLQDVTVPYSGLSFMESIPKVIEYWRDFNSCDIEPDRIIQDNFSAGYVINIDEYKNCSNDVNVKLILHSTMGHTWPSTNNHSVSASNEVWNFVSQFDLNGKIN